eukprot:TRINITY_DN2707_c0_g1_i2.p1 TRINITY_DN2707_c0_g1~~TRINITY_DN2707_c0_g1_i2.p1  ORF type:complete len:550 (+),score=50.64 TRINITY_DN2707_c0_g1_i2:43-1692(+)
MGAAACKTNKYADPVAKPTDDPKPLHSEIPQEKPFDPPSSANENLLLSPVPSPTNRDLAAGLIAPARHRICHLDDFPEGSSRLVRAPDGRNVVVFHNWDGFFALDNACYHHGGPLYSGTTSVIEGHKCVKCPWHGYIIDVESGNGLYLGLERDASGNQIRSKGPRQRTHRVELIDSFVDVIFRLEGSWESDTYATMPLANREHPPTQGMLLATHMDVIESHLPNQPQRRRSNVVGMQSGQPVSSWIAKCVEVREETSSVRTFVLCITRRRRNGPTAKSDLDQLGTPSPSGTPASQHQFEYIPGQYALFDIAVHGEDVAPIRRSWTISSAPNSPLPSYPPHITITVKRLPSGVASSFLHETLRPGGTLSVSHVCGSFGFFFHNSALAAADGRALLLAAGIGITPFASMLRALFLPPISQSPPAGKALSPSQPFPGLQRAPSIPASNDIAHSRMDIVLLYSERRIDNFVFLEDLQGFAGSDSAGSAHQLQLYLTLTGNLPRIWSGERGRVDLAMITRLVPDFKYLASAIRVVPAVFIFAAPLPSWMISLPP